MARCRLGPKKLRKYSRIFGIDFKKGMVRGNTNHRVDLRDDDDSFITYPPFKKLYKDMSGDGDFEFYKEVQ